MRSPRVQVLVCLVVGVVLLAAGAVGFGIALAQPPELDVVATRDLFDTLRRQELLDRWLTFGLPVAGLVVLALGAGIAIGARAGRAGADDPTVRVTPPAPADTL
jgi:hypothetical protein